ncbi:DUF922 domain-containing protein [Legionella jordanis]|uniref:Secreted Zn-dependent protease n=1 Tax=Legionella jordanis TaxID=456 RepID=A0A0W0V994_9GAMM|nr:DUF922 domain-containing protein [Legionella jordanis]KTD16707.1 hypothetical protein Ljor_1013 [Legionella jordanis]RMX03763.1 DUF922 domain-containing protein [Legionella jordanis]RMX22175.1 DUF922 domain-containing protein [Legionella jordanis]VEH11825.1 Predicted secreted Zn-dependent protease [Legionella jordanis]HAT8712866.1 DUF922 domain-containing protein [Legionella jordanis]
MSRIIISSLIILFHLQAWSTPIVQKSQTFYGIKGDNENELRNQLNSLGPVIKNKRFDAQTTWHISWTYSWQAPNSSDESCTLKNAQVTITIEQLLPQWLDQASGSLVLQAKWNNYMAALLKHEQLHESNGMEAAQEIEAALLKIPPKDSCPDLANAVETTANAILQQHNISDQKIDIDSNYGLLMGASFP